MNREQRIVLRKIIKKIDAQAVELELAEELPVPEQYKVVLTLGHTAKAIQDEVEEVISDEEGKLDAMPDTLRGGMPGQRLEEVIEVLSEASNDLESVIDMCSEDYDESCEVSIGEIVESLSMAINNIEEAINN